MSKFERIRGENIDINVSPTGWRRFWILRRLPYFAGDWTPLRVDIKRLPPGSQYLQIRLDYVGDPPHRAQTPILRVDPSVHTIVRLQFDYPLRNTGEFNFRLSVADEYLWNGPSHSAATIQASTEWFIFAAIGVVSTGLITWGLTELVRRIF